MKIMKKYTAISPLALELILALDINFKFIQ